MLGDFYAVCADIQIRVDIQKFLFECIGFVHAKMAHKILLAVEVGDVYFVKIHQMQMADTDARQRKSDI